MKPNQNPKKAPAPKLTRAQRVELKSLVEDSGYTRAEALAWVRSFPPSEAGAERRAR